MLPAERGKVPLCWFVRTAQILPFLVTNNVRAKVKSTSMHPHLQQHPDDFSPDSMKSKSKMQLFTYDEVREFECRELTLNWKHWQRNIEMLLDYNEHWKWYKSFYAIFFSLFRIIFLSFFPFCLSHLFLANFMSMNLALGCHHYIAV